MTEGQDGMELSTDRRTLMKASGAAAGAGALGLAAGSVTADSDQEHYLVASDAHLGSPYANPERFEQFVSTEVPTVDPDVLVLAGDIYEQWFRGMGSTLLEYSNVTEILEMLHANGTEVVVVTGNHDRRLITVGADDNEDLAPGEPWTYADEYFFESGDEEFVAVHGDDGDPLQQDPISQLLCVGTDDFGALMIEVMEWWDGLNPFATVGETGSVTVTATGTDLQRVALSASYDDPVVVTSPPATTDGLVQPRVNTLTPARSRRDIDRFEIRLDEWEDNARVDATTVDYAVLERGRHVLGVDTPAEAGRVTAGDEWVSVSFDEAFDQRPIVLADVQTADDDAWSPRFGGEPATPAVPDVRNVRPSGFQVRLREDGSGVSSPAEVGFLAVERGRPTVQGRRVEAADNVISESGPLGLDREFADTPTLLAAPQTAVTDAPVLPAYEQVGPDSAHLTLRDATGTPVSGTVGYLALGGTGPLLATESTAVPTVNAESRLESKWHTILDEEDELPLPEPIPPESLDSPPAMAGLEPKFLGHDAVRDNLLDMYEEFVVFGHTHMPDLGDRHANSGAWTSRRSGDTPENTYVEIDGGQVTVWNSTPTGREKLFES